MSDTVSGFKVSSLANGEMIIQVDYVDEPVDEDATPVGLLTRLTIANEIEKILMKSIGEINSIFK